jgi:hypothetical protein
VNGGQTGGLAQEAVERQILSPKCMAGELWISRWQFCSDGVWRQSCGSRMAISIDRSDELENASDSIRVNREFDSTEIDENDRQYEKHDDPRISPFRGLSIDRSDEDDNASDSIRINPEDNSNEKD